MTVGRFYGGIAALVRSASDGRYLVLQRVADRDFGAGVWECVTGRVDQGEGFEDALHREVAEEIGVRVEVDCILGTSHFYRGTPAPENELLGVVYCCTLAAPDEIRLGDEHAAYRWVTPQQANEVLSATDPSTEWIRRVIKRAEQVRQLLPPALIEHNRAVGFEMG